MSTHIIMCTVFFLTRKKFWWLNYRLKAEQHMLLPIVRLWRNCTIQNKRCGIFSRGVALLYDNARLEAENQIQEYVSRLSTKSCRWSIWFPVKVWHDNNNDVKRAMEGLIVYVVSFVLMRSSAMTANSMIFQKTIILKYALSLKIMILDINHHHFYKEPYSQTVLIF